MTQHLDESTLSELREMMDGEFEFLISTFIEDSRQRLEVIRDTLNDPGAFSRACHSLKGSATNLGLPRLSELCREGEELGREGEELGHTGRIVAGDDLVSRIESEFDEVVQRLQDYI